MPGEVIRFEIEIAVLGAEYGFCYRGRAPSLDQGGPPPHHALCWPFVGVLSPLGLRSLGFARSGRFAGNAEKPAHGGDFSDVLGVFPGGTLRFLKCPLLA